MTAMSGRDIHRRKEITDELLCTAELEGFKVSCDFYRDKSSKYSALCNNLMRYSTGSIMASHIDISTEKD